MVKRIVSLWLLFLFMGVLSCEPEDCGGPVYYGIDSISSIPMKFVEGQLLDYMVDTSSTPYYQYALQITIEPDYMTSGTPSAGSWFSPAYACEPAPYPTDTLASVAVVSETDFSTADGRTIAAGQNLIAEFDVGNGYGVIIESGERYTRRLPILAENQSLVLVLATAPAEPQSHRFTVRYQLTGGETFSAIAPPVTITP